MIKIFILSVFLSSISQILLKISANRNYSVKLKEYINPYVIVGYILFFTANILVIFAYREIDLKNGPILNSMGYLFVLVLSRAFLKEKITKNKIIGNLLIIVGIIIFNL